MKEWEPIIEKWMERLVQLAQLSAECREHEFARQEMQQIEATIHQLRYAIEALRNLEAALGKPQRHLVVREFGLLSPAPPFFKEGVSHE